METLATGQAVNDKLREAGICALVDLAGDRLWFFPKGRLPAHLHAYLHMSERRHARALRNYLVSLARVTL